MDWLSYVSQLNWPAVLLAFIATVAVGFTWCLSAVVTVQAGCHHRADVLTSRTTPAKGGRP